MKKKINIPLLIICILIPLAVGFLSAYIVGDNTFKYQNFNRPPLSPPGAIFPVVWTILYIIMGISSYIILQSDSKEKGFALRLYAVNLFLNFFWSIIFFSYEMYFFAFIWLLILLFVVLWMVREFRKISPVAAALNIPYILWLVFAAYLNFGVFILN